MYAKILYFAGAICHIYSASASKVPFITKCARGDSQCITKSSIAVLPKFVAGMPEFGVEKLDPMFIKSLDASNQNLKLHMSDITVTGLKDAIINLIKLDVKKNRLHISAEFTCRATSKYHADGSILILPIKGQGDALIELNKAQFEVNTDFDERPGKDGKTYFHISNVKYNYVMKAKAKIEMGGLFDGNELLSHAVKELLKSNPNEIVTEVGAPVFDAVVEKVVHSMKNFFLEIPAEDILLFED